MKSILVTLSLLILAVFAQASPLRQLADEVNSKQSYWRAGVNKRFENDHDFSLAKRLCGTLETPAHLQLPIMLSEVDEASLPAEFDARQQWPKCNSIQEVRDQSNCGSCWAFGAVEAASDRICVATGENVHLSARDLLSCCMSCGSGCNGGYLGPSWSWLKNTGAVTGGNWDDNSMCSSYPFEICDHHVTGSYVQCSDLNGGDTYATPKCQQKCDANSTYTTAYADDKHKFATAYSVAANVAQIQNDIMTYGPVEAAFTVYSDFLNYKSGVYYHVSGQALGGHAIKLLGWGNENGMDYWLAANSWNEEWGDKGFFKIRRGKNECGIEGNIVAGHYTN